MKAERQLDAVDLGILWDRLISVTNEIVETLVRTSFSTVARDNYDLSCVLFDAKGRSIAQGTMSVPVFIGTAPQTMRHMLAAIPPETLKPGDVIITNDIWMGTGHLWDVNVMKPAFRGGQLVGYAMSISHLPDIGGRGFSAINTSMYEEGLQIPIRRIVSEGHLDTSLIDLIRRNVRVPDQVIGDIMANVAAVEVGCCELVSMMDEYAIDDLGSLADAVIDQSIRSMHSAIEAIPDGRYRESIQVESLGAPITLACVVTVAGNTIHVDFEGTSASVQTAINVPICYTLAMTAYSIKALLLPAVPNNWGSVAPISVTAPDGCILNAAPPSATGARFMVGHFVAPLIFGALAPALPNQTQGDPGMMGILNVVGRNTQGREFSTLFFSSGGFGALSGLDGVAATPAPSNMMVMPSETWEMMTGMRVISRRLLPDSGGPGQYRGGLGQEIILQNATQHPMTVFTMGVRTTFPAKGVCGGGSGSLRQYRVNGISVQAQGQYTLKTNDRLELFDAGGGGYGDPLARDRQFVADDIRLGYVTEDAARCHYGYHAEN